MRIFEKFFSTQPLKLVTPPISDEEHDDILTKISEFVNNPKSIAVANDIICDTDDIVTYSITFDVYSEWQNIHNNDVIVHTSNILKDIFSNRIEGKSVRHLRISSETIETMIRVIKTSNVLTIDIYD